MNEKDISEALRRHISTLADAPSIVWENEGGDKPNPPFLLISQIKQPPIRLGHSTSKIYSGELIADVMARAGGRQEGQGFTTVAETLAESIVGHFPLDLDISAGSGTVSIIQPAYSDEGYNDGTYWRVKTHVRWRAV